MRLTSVFRILPNFRVGIALCLGTLCGTLALMPGVGLAQERAKGTKVSASKAPVKSTAKGAESESAEDAKEDSKPVAKGQKKPFSTGSTDVLVEFINEKIAQGWEDNEIEPSDIADDNEWVRRVHLDIVGHIPPADVVESFVADKDKAKRSKLIETLLDDPAYVRNWTTIWTNLSIGRQTPRRVSRTGMQKFYREAFAKNRPWKDVVYDIVSAEGHYEENGAVNFLLAQMTMADEQVQATAKTTRLFMGMQVQCTQCHNHPFNDWKQDQFWQFNTFFRQARKIDHRKYNPKTGRDEDDFSELVSQDAPMEVFFEKRNGLMQVAKPVYLDRKMTDDPELNRRQELAKFMIDGEAPMVARAAVNRMWGHFFGYGFTKPVDDMGPHNAPSHPEILDRLTVEFVKSGYDLKQLIRWIANTEAYNLGSRSGKKNEGDNPLAGETPMFSKVYVKPLEAEQLYDSLIIATDAHKSGRSSWEQADQTRTTWMRQFVLAFGNDENEESTTFNGTIPQALMMMNGELVQNAMSNKKGSYLETVLSDRTNEIQKINRLYVSTLSRAPTKKELAAAQKLIKMNNDKLVAFQDLYWALLNSNEFIMNH
jgi:hypothetical protein